MRLEVRVGPQSEAHRLIRDAIAKALVEMRADWPNGWVYLGRSLMELKRRHEAYDMVTRAMAKFPVDVMLPRNNSFAPHQAK